MRKHRCRPQRGEGGSRRSELLFGRSPDLSCFLILGPGQYIILYQRESRVCGERRDLAERTGMETEIAGSGPEFPEKLW